MLSRVTIRFHKGATPASNDHSAHRETMAVASLRTSRPSAFEERLDNIMFMELCEDGTSEYQTMTLRALYKYVVACISRNCKNASIEKTKTKGSGELSPPREKAQGTVKLSDDSENTGRTVKFRDETPGAENPPVPSSPPQSGEEGSAPPKPKPSLKATRNYKSFRNQRQVAVSGTADAAEGDPRERLGGYLHPRDMRRLVTPFSGSNEPQLMVRRHVMLLNFDPLRAIVLKDRLLVLVPEGADSILLGLEKKIKGGFKELEDDVFGSEATKNRFSKTDSTTTEEDVTDDDDGDGDGWEDVANMDWSNVPYELLSLDSVLQTVTSMLADDATHITQRTADAIRELRGDSGGEKISGMPGENAQERLRWLKDNINDMEGRVQAFVRALHEKLDDEEGMALMNLSRLLTHPERFIQPVAPDILHEESDEPELILEAYLQQALSIVNALDLQRAQIATTQEQISMTLDAMRNKLLYINTVLSLASFVMGSGSFIGSLFGMNVTNPYQDLGTEYFLKVCWGTVLGMILLFFTLTWYFFWQTSGSGRMK